MYIALRVTFLLSWVPLIGSYGVVKVNSIFAHWISAYLIYGNVHGLFVRFINFVQIP